MNKAKTYCCIVALALVMLPVTAFAQEAFISKVNINLTVTSTVPALAERDADGKKVKPRTMVFENEYENNKGIFYEAGSKMQKSKISNKEILQWLVNENIINAVKGHKIATIGEMLVVVTPGGDIIPIDEHIGFSCLANLIQIPIFPPPMPVAFNGDAGAVVFQENVKVKELFGSLGYVVSDSDKEKCNAVAWFDIDNNTAEGYGILSRKSSFNFKDSGGDIDAPATKGSSNFKFKGGTLDTISGWYQNRNVECDDYLEGPECRSLVEGKIKVGRGRPIAMMPEPTR
jgi:hypothetical protein